MRLLWARVGVPYSPATGLPIAAQTVSQMVDRTMALPEGTRLYLLAPVVRGRKGEYRKELAEWQKAGFTRVRIDGQFYEIEDAPALDKKYKHDIEVVVDRLVVRGDRDAAGGLLETALKLAEGLVYLDPADDPLPERRGTGEGRGKPSTAARRPFRVAGGEEWHEARLRRPRGGSSFPRSSPARFRASPSPRSSRDCSRSTRRRAPARAATGWARSCCSTRTWSSPTRPCRSRRARWCPGRGRTRRAPITCRCWAAWRANSISASTRRGASCPRRCTPHPQRHRGRPVTLRFVDGRKSYEVNKAFDGVIGNLQRRMLQTESAWMREELSKYQSAARARPATARGCGPSRWR